MSKQEAYIHKREAELRHWNAKIEELKAKAAKAKTETKIRYYKQVEELLGKQQKARERLLELKQEKVSEQIWDDIQAKAEEAWEEFKHALEKAARILK